MDYDAFFSGERLFGDDFTEEQIAEWYQDEKEAYANLGAGDAASYVYGYHGWNRWHAFRHLPKRRFRSALGFGSAYGEEFLPVLDAIDTITIVEPSNAFRRTCIHGVPATYVNPAISGMLPFDSDSFDLTICFDALHHVPNVSTVVRELGRVTRGYAVIREPIVSMGDWRKARQGLTKHERGIPSALLRTFVADAGLELVHSSYCAHPVTQRLFNGLRAKTLNGIYSRTFPTLVDAALSTAFSWNLHYHPRTLLQKLCPAVMFMVLRKAHTV